VFSKSVLNSLKLYIVQLDSSFPSELFSKTDIAVLVKFLDSIRTQSNIYNDYAPITINALSDRAMEIFQQLKYDDKSVGFLYLFCARLIKEKRLRAGSISSTEENLFNFYLEETKFKGLFPDDLDYLQVTLPIEIINESAERSTGSISAITGQQKGLEDNLTNLTDNMTQLKGDIDGMRLDYNALEASLNNKTTQVKEMLGKLEELRQSFNFVGLAKGFHRLLSTKVQDLEGIKKYLVLFGIGLVIPIILRVLLDLFPDSSSGWTSYLPYLALEIILLYYFRILLSQYYSIKAQIIQLELRLSLCEFVESYVDFIAEKDSGKDSERKLEKFEAIIFSGLAADLKSIPSTFDGLEQLVSIVKEIKK